MRKRRKVVSFIVTLPLPEDVKVRDLADVIRECIRDEGYKNTVGFKWDDDGDTAPGPLYGFGDRVTVKPWTP